VLYEAWLGVPFRVGAFVLSVEILGRVGYWCGVEGAWEECDFVGRGCGGCHPSE